MPLFSFEGFAPAVSPTAWIAPTATLVGDVRVEDEASVWYGAVVTVQSARLSSITIKNLVFPEWWLLWPLPVCFALLAIEFAFRLHRPAFCDGDLGRHLRQSFNGFAFGQRTFAKPEASDQCAVHDQVRVSPYGRGEMRVTPQV